VTFTTAAAPVLPFVTEEIYQGLVRVIDPDAPESVHHTDYPEAYTAAIDRDLEAAMDTVRTVVNLGRALRKREDVRTRQPLRSVTVVTRDPAHMAAIESHADLISEELNVHDVLVHANEGGLVDLEAKPNYKQLGPRYGKEMKAVASAIESLDHDTIISLLDGSDVTIGGYVLTGEDVIVSRIARKGTAVATEGSVSVALDTSLDSDLEIEGMAREIVNRIQGARRDAGFAVTDRIVVRWTSNDPLVTEAFSAHHTLISSEVLASALVSSDTVDGEDSDLLGHRFAFTVETQT
jgi:isoleucyl-tRNA synthetase